jgi:hypothetical protein
MQLLASELFFGRAEQLGYTLISNAVFRARVCQPDGIFDREEQLFTTDRFIQILERTWLHCLYRELYAAKSGQDYYRCAWRALLYLAENLLSGNLRKIQIGDYGAIEAR